MFVLKRQKKGGAVTNSNLLKSVMIKNGDTQQDLADAIGVSISTLNAKINGKRSSFRQSEIIAIMNRYNLEASEVVAIFFAE